MGSLERRLRRLEAEREREGAQLSREALTHLSDEDLHALEGDSGPFWVFRGGMLYQDTVTWRFLDV